MSVNVRPLGKKILVRFHEAEEEIIGGIIVRNPDKRSQNRTATVQATGPGYRGDLAPGDTVYTKPYCGTEIRLNGELIAFVAEDDILAARED